MTPLVLLPAGGSSPSALPTEFFRGSTPSRSAPPVTLAPRLLSCLRTNQSVTGLTVRLDTGPVASGYPGGILTRSNERPCQAAADPEFVRQVGVADQSVRPLDTMLGRCHARDSTAHGNDAQTLAVEQSTDDCGQRIEALSVDRITCFAEEMPRIVNLVHNWIRVTHPNPPRSAPSGVRACPRP